ncbi:MAG: glutaminyl-peptide cyclotransferase, partial [Chloroflexota bacterium]
MNSVAQNHKTPAWHFILFATILIALAGIVLLILSNIQTTSRPVSSIPLDLGYQAGFEVINRYPHDHLAFTQGLIFHEGQLYESTGLNGRSSLRKVDLETGEVLQMINVDQTLFAEGLTEWQGTLIQLTWRDQLGLVYDLDSFQLLRSFDYSSEGWGLTHDEHHLIMSDGSDTLHFIDPNKLIEVKQIRISESGIPITRINELEYINGEIYANIWQTNKIVRIDPTDGNVIGWINLAGLLPQDDFSASVDVLNGIAYNSSKDRLFVTGKLWPYLYE